MESSIRKLLDEIGIESSLMVVPIQPTVNAKIDNCIPNVEVKISIDGGALVYGWKVNQNVNFVEGIYHAIWKSDTDEYIDITPTIDNSRETLFLEDGRPLYKGQQIKSVMLNLSGTKMVDELIEMYDILYEIENRGDRAHISGEKILITHREKEVREDIITRRVLFATLLEKGYTMNSRCYCGSGKKFKICCYNRKFIRIVHQKLGY